jgi:ParB-like chromosome segregation protein Spo0J
MQVRDRIREFRRVRAESLRPHPRNWRTHPPAQQEALRGVLAEIGYADALLVRELADGALQLIDGHLRAELTPDALVPVLVLDVTEEEALKLLVTLDPLAAQAESDARLLHGLLEEVQTESAAVAELLKSLAEANPLADAVSQPTPDDLFVPASFQVVVQCDDEDQQRDVYERLKAEGYQCRVLSL